MKSDHKVKHIYDISDIIGLYRINSRLVCENLHNVWRLANRATIKLLPIKILVDEWKRRHVALKTYWFKISTFNFTKPIVEFNKFLKIILFCSLLWCYSTPQIWGNTPSQSTNIHTKTQTAITNKSSTLTVKYTLENSVAMVTGELTYLTVVLN